MLTITNQCYVQGDDRTLAANIGAAACYSVGQLEQGGARQLVARAEVVLVEGFFLAHR